MFLRAPERGSLLFPSSPAPVPRQLIWLAAIVLQSLGTCTISSRSVVFAIHKLVLVLHLE